MKRLAALVLLTLGVAGCGFGSGSSTADVTVTVSRDFGASRLQQDHGSAARSGDTVMRLLERRYTVKTRFGGGFVQEIDGVSGGKEQGRPVDWFYYVNGIEASQGAAERKVEPGDNVWWDHHDWEAAMRVPAVVGSFPEPFASGEGGKKFPVRLVCFTGAGRSCDEVETRLESAGVDALARSNLEQSVGKVLRILVGPWTQVRKDIASRQLEIGPKASGVFAKLDPSGSQIALLDPSGKVQRTLGPGSGLVAATSFTGQEPTWIVTGTDGVGVAAAAAAMTADRLRNHFALAISGGRGVSLPVESP
jgi:hypothetical protein